MTTSSDVTGPTVLVMYLSGGMIKYCVGTSVRLVFPFLRQELRLRLVVYGLNPENGFQPGNRFLPSLV